MAISSTIKLRGRDATTGQAPASLVSGEVALNEADHLLFHRNKAGAVSDLLLCGLRPNAQSDAYTCVLADAGCSIVHPTADTTARTFTIPANASVAYPIGTTLTFINLHGAGVLTIAITSDAMYLAGAGTTGSRTLAANGIATAVKVAAAEWIISGRGLT